MFHMRRGRLAAAIATATLAGLTLTACGGSSGGPSADDTGPPSGELLVLTNRTDIVDTEFVKYAKKFNETYPDVKVKFEALSADEVKTRMSTKDYGDVLLIPNDVSGRDLPDFFEPLGATAELSKKYRFSDSKAYEDQSYGIATFGNANGMVYNKKVFKEAGITELPKTPEEFMSDMQAVKDKTKAIPYYTNYKDGWPLGWPVSLLGAVSGDPEASVKMAENDTPWGPGQELNTLDSLMYKLVKNGLTEKDPTTTNWENSKSLIGKGEVAMMPLGTWALPQMEKAATDTGNDPKDIGYMPAPFQTGGKFNSPIGPDWMQGINVNSENKKAARLWIDFFTNDSGFYEFAGGIPAAKDKPMPKALQEFADEGVNFIETKPAPKRDLVDNQSEIGITQPDPYRDLVDSARGASKKSEQQLYDEWNKKWADARTKVK